MKLYHGTSLRRARMISEAGMLQPRSHTRQTNWKANPSNPHCIYLTDAYPLYFASTALGAQEKGGAVYEIDTDRLGTANLYPDEDVIEQTSRGKDGLPMDWDMRKRTRYYRQRIRQMQPEAWKISMQVMGTCAHWGPIPLSAVTRIAWYGEEEDLDLAVKIAALDPSITPINYRLVGEKYKLMVQWLFDGPDALPPAMEEAVGGDSDQIIPSRLDTRAFHYPTMIRAWPRTGIRIENRGG